MADHEVTLADLRADVDRFVAAREWHQFHNAKDLAISICLEAAELLEEYQWKDADQVRSDREEESARERVGQELADILIYCLCLANALGLDVSEEVRSKLALSAQKYPAASYAGRKPNSR